MPTAIPQTAIDNWVISATRFQNTCDFYPALIARKSALEKTQLSDVLITDNLF